MKTAIVLSVIAIIFSIGAFTFVCLAILYGNRKLDNINGAHAKINQAMKNTERRIKYYIDKKIEPLLVKTDCSSTDDTQALINMILNGSNIYTRTSLEHKPVEELEEIVEQVNKAA